MNRSRHTKGGRMTGMLKLYIQLARASIRSRMQYKFNFVLSSLLTSFITVAEFLTIAVVLLRFQTIQDWNIYEIGYLFSVLNLSRYLYRVLAADINGFEKYMVQGLFDQSLLRPVPVLLVLMTRNFRPMAGELAQGLTVFTVCIWHLIASGQTTWLAIPLTALTIISGTAIVFAVGLATATCGFWIQRIEDLQVLTDNAPTLACQFPLSIFPQWIRTPLLIVVPYGFVAYVPSLYILRGAYGPWALAGSFAAAVCFLALALRLWKFGIAHYQSTGS
ncbi:ABC-2 family transporter protein [Paenibacillus sp. P25]|nr:ABC-2 family transporter protein [Paenibacillus sp. P25]